jgi:hypothetical protein
VTEGPGPDRTAPVGPVLAQAAETAVINAPVAKVDLFEWLRTLPDREFQRCAPPDHKAVGFTVTDDGAPLTVMVETIGAGLLVHHYTYQAAGKAHCRLVSVTDVLAPAGWTTCQVIWELTAEPVDDQLSRYTNAMTSYPTTRLRRFLAGQHQSLDDAAAAAQAALAGHCRRETSRFAESIGRHANALN